jgi:hypothetical protein
LNRAVRAPPIWRKPVGDGAKRVITGSGMASALLLGTEEEPARARPCRGGAALT